jgi:hypothetical protein
VPVDGLCRTTSTFDLFREAEGKGKRLSRSDTVLVAGPDRADAIGSMEGRSNQPSTVGVGLEIWATRVNEFGSDEWVEHGALLKWRSTP